MSEQANNRRGAGWLGVGTLTAAEVNALSAAHGQGPWTESNRARAARHGFTMSGPPLKAGESAILRLDNTGPEPVASASRDGGQTWEPVGDPRLRPSDGRDPDMEAKIHALALDVAHAGICTYAEARAHVEAMLAPRMERLDAGQVREVFERAVGPCPTPDEADRLYGRGSDLALRIRAAWEVSPRGADGAILAPEMVTERTGPASKQPAPAPGQVWLPPPSVAAEYADMLDPVGTLTVREIQGGRTVVFLDGLMHYQAADMLSEGWTCLGVATPHGRVMVGDGWAVYGGPECNVVGVDGRADYVVMNDGRARSASSLITGAERHGYRRTRYAPARAGERFRAGGGYCDDWTIDAYDVGRVFDAAAYERLDPGQGAGHRVYAALKVSVNGRELRDVTGDFRPDTATGADLDTIAATMGIERRAAAQPSVAATLTQDARLTLGQTRANHFGDKVLLTAYDPNPFPRYRVAGVKDGDESISAAMLPTIFPFIVEDGGETARVICTRLAGTVPRSPTAYEHAAAALRARDLTLSLGADVVAVGAPPPERPALTLQAPAAQLRALFDAIGRALELPATRHVCAFGEGLTVTVLRDEMLFTPTAETGLGTADLAGDARALCALRACIATAMAIGVAHLAQWGAKGPRVEVQREGGPMAAPVAEQASEAPRYQPDAGGGAGAWRWEAGDAPSGHVGGALTPSRP